MDRDQDIDWDALEIELLPEERKLLLAYGCPFEPESQQLESMSPSRSVETLIISRFYLKQMIGDLSHAIHKQTRGQTRHALIELCDRLEYAERSGDGQIEAFFD